jgi:toxin ParE1/3/4
VAHRIVYLAAARDDLSAIYDWIADHSDPDTADAYVTRLQGAIDRLANYPDRDAPRDDAAPGLRTMAFERRAVIAYLVDRETVRVVRVLHRGRDLGLAFE